MASAARPVGLALLLCIVFGAGFLFEVTVRAREHVRPEREAALGREDDPLARERYEWMRTHDPATGRIPERIREKEIAFSSKLPTRRTFKGLRKEENVNVAWINRGPENVGGRTRALGIDLFNPSIILAGGVSGGMWRSTDAGQTWRRTTPASQIPSVSCLAQDPRPTRAGTWYYGTGELVGNSSAFPGTAYRGDGIFKSTDNGLTWNLLPATSTGVPQSFDQMFDYVHDICVDPSAVNQDVVYAATIGGISRSSDGGATWIPVLGGLSGGSRFTDVAVTSGGVAYATMSENDINNLPDAASRGVWRSTDGVHWTSITPPNWPALYRRIVIGIAPSNQNIVYFLGETPGSGFQTKYAGEDEATSFWKYTYLSGDGSGAGGVWEDRSSSLPAYGGSVGDFVSQGGYDLAIAVHPTNDSTVFIGGTNVYRSRNAFRTSSATDWVGGYATANNVSVYAQHHPDQHALRFVQHDSLVLYSGHDGGISMTTAPLAETVVWRSLDNGYTTAQFYTIALDHATPGNPALVGGLQDNGTWLATGANPAEPWVELLGGDGAYCALADQRSSTYASFENGVIYRLLVNTVTGDYTSYTRVDPGGSAQNYLFIHPFALDPQNTNIMYLPVGETLWRNSDLTGIPLNSDTSTSVNWTSLDGVQAGAAVTAVGVSRSAPQHRLYFGTNNGHVFRLDNADTAGNSAAAVDIWSGKNLPADAYVSCMAVDPVNGDRAIVVFSNYNVPSLFLTTDAGATWTPVGGNLEQNPDGSGNGPSTRWVSILNTGSSAEYFVGTSTGLYSTGVLNGAATVWVKESPDVIGNAVVDMVDVRPSDGMVAVATHGAGAFTGTVSTDISSPSANVPLQFALEQNWPNPFNPATNIAYTVHSSQFTVHSTDVKLVVYDLLGREVAVLVNEKQAPGRYTVRFDAGKLASGVYLYRLQAGSFVETKRMLLLR